MNIRLFKKPYIVRHYAKQEIVNGYPVSTYEDTILRLDVQPLGTDELQALPEGERTVKRIKSFGVGRLASADEFNGVPGDRLFYHGRWYECKSSVMWNHIILSHYRSEFVILPQSEQKAPESEEVGDP